MKQSNLLRVSEANKEVIGFIVTKKLKKDPTLNKLTKE
jgi:hypothetical protein